MQNRIIFDWFAVSLNLNSLDEFFEFLPMFSQIEYENIYGFYGYKQRLNAIGINIFFDGTEEMGILLELSGKGCRFVEEFSGFDWFDFFNYLNDSQKIKNVTRLDVAFDIFDNSLPIKRLSSDISKFNYVSRFSKHELRETTEGNSIRLGSPTSLIMFRIYDKGAEQNIITFPWVRFEIQFRKDRALSYFNKLLQGYPSGELFFGVVNNYFRIIKNDNARIERAKMKKYWKEFLMHENKIQIFEKAKTDYDLDDLKNYVFRQAGNSIRAYIDIVGQEQFNKELFNFVPRYSNKQKLIINKNASDSDNFSV